MQVISLGTGCGFGAAVHEIGHAVGLWHEQSREDRDRFVRIVWANIQAGREHNFNQHITDGDDIGGYDFGSIMHYPRTAFSRNGQDTIVAGRWPGHRAADRAVGRRHRRRAGDVPGARAFTVVARHPVHRHRPGERHRQLVHAQLAVALVRRLDGRPDVAGGRRSGAARVDGANEPPGRALLKYHISVRNLGGAQRLVRGPLRGARLEPGPTFV